MPHVMRWLCWVCGAAMLSQPGLVSADCTTPGDQGGQCGMPTTCMCGGVSTPCADHGGGGGVRTTAARAPAGGKRRNHRSPPGLALPRSALHSLAATALAAPQMLRPGSAGSRAAASAFSAASRRLSSFPGVRSAPAATAACQNSKKVGVVLGVRSAGRPAR